MLACIMGRFYRSDMEKYHGINSNNNDYSINCTILLVI